MSANPNLPFLPGYQVQIPKSQNFHKSHVFDVKNGLRDLKEPGSAPPAPTYSRGAISSLKLVSTEEDLKTELLKSSSLKPTQFNPASARATASASQQGAKPPAWVAFDRVVLRFFGYFKESVHASSIENFRVRKVVVYYYLEDSSVHVAEPKVENSGIPQGTFVKRHRLPKPDGSPLLWSDLAVGVELPVYGRVFRLVDADDATRQFFASQGRQLAPPEPYPADPFQKKQTQKPAHFHKMMHPMKEFMEAYKGKMMNQIAGTQKFLKNDGKVLRFYCCWNDENLYGEKRPYILHYFLADDTIEIVEIQQPNSGRDAFSSLLKRQRLPKNATSNYPDVSRIGIHGKDENLAYYTAQDLKVGSCVNVFTRELLIQGCDKFTQDHYVKTFNADPEDYHELKIEEEVEEVPKMLPPPHNGIGTEEDSLGSFLYLMPKVPKQDFKKLMENDGINLRYLARFIDPQVEDKDRRFIITYYLSNDTVSVFEKFERNSGFVGGKFLERNRVKNPETGEYFKATDFFLNARVTINKYRFEIIEIDQYTRKYMADYLGIEDTSAANQKEDEKKAPQQPSANSQALSTSGRLTSPLTAAGAKVVSKPSSVKSPTNGSVDNKHNR